MLRHIELLLNLTFSLFRFFFMIEMFKVRPCLLHNLCPKMKNHIWGFPTSYYYSYMMLHFGLIGLRRITV